MRHSFNEAEPSDPVRMPDSYRPSSDQIGLGFAAVVKTAVLAHYGSVKAAAISLGNVDPSLMQREFNDAKFGRIDEHADAAAKANIARALFEAYGRVLVTPYDHVRDVARQVRALADEIDQAAELLR